LYIVNQLTLTAIMLGSTLGSLVLSFILFFVQLTIEGQRLRREALASKARRLRHKADDKAVTAPQLPFSSMMPAAKFFHLFLSHVWGTGQDQMRIIKQRLLEMIPDLSVFLDVDDLEEIGNLESYIERSSSVLVYCSRGYFASKNCMRELVSSTVKQKAMIALVDMDASRGGLTLEEVQAQLVEADVFYDKWAFNNEPGAPRAMLLYEHLTIYEPIEWNRIGHFQDVTMRLIAERTLPDAAGTTYVDREIISQKRKPLSPPTASFHVYCSKLNPGANELIEELCGKCGFELNVDAGATTKMPSPLYLTTEAASVAKCDHMLLYLTEQTWTRGAASASLYNELMRAMDMDVHVQLAHEMPGVGGQEVRSACEFGAFFSHPDGATPVELLERGIYSEIAVPLKGGAWREASMVLMGIALGMSKDAIADAGLGSDVLGLRESTQMLVARAKTRSLKINKLAKSSGRLLNSRMMSGRAGVTSYTSTTATESVDISVTNASLSADAGSSGLELASPGTSSSTAAKAEHDDVYIAQRSFVETQTRMNDGLKV